jgi:hypothetical protein
MMARRASYNLHLIGHVRSPREFNQPFETARLNFVRLLDDLIAHMVIDGADNTYPLRALLLDGQSSLIEDYLALRPDQFDAVERLVQNGKLALGPWYVLPHTLLVSGEGLIRNLSLGLRTARTFGLALECAYLPNGGGQTAQLPQILRGFQLDSAVLVRGLGDKPAEFAWDSPDGSRVTAIYWRAGLAPLSSAGIEAVRADLAPYSAMGHLSIPFQVKSAESLSALPELLSRVQRELADTVFQSTLPNYLTAIQAIARDLPVVRGELRSPAHTAIDQGTLTTRGWVKQRLQQVDTLLTRWVEPFTGWTSLLETVEASVVPPRLIRPALDHAWRLLSQNHAPETLGGTAADVVYADVRQRFDQAEQIGEALLAGVFQALAELVDTSAGQQQALVVFNPGSTARAELVDVLIDVPRELRDNIHIVDWHGDPVEGTITSRPGLATGETILHRVSFVAPDVPPAGLTTFFLVPGAPPPIPNRPLSGIARIENTKLSAIFDPDGFTVTLTDKIRDVTYFSVVDIQVDGDVGDARSFNPVGGAVVVNRRLADSSMFVSYSPERDRIGYRMLLTIEPTADMLPPHADNVILAVDVEYTLWRDIGRFDVRLVIDNTLANHRVRVHCPLPFVATSAHYDMPFEIIERPVEYLPPISPPDSWAETPLSAMPQGSFVAVLAPGTEPARPGLIIANRGLREADVFAMERDVRSPAEIAVTALRSVSYRLRPDLFTRAPDVTDNAVPELAAGLEARGEHVIELSLIPTDAQSFSADCGEAWGFSEGSFRVAITGSHAGTLPTHVSLIAANNPAFRISAIKLPEDETRGGFIVRGYNITGDSQMVSLTPWRPFSLVDVIRLDESETGGRLALDADGSISFRAAPHRILTFWFHD